MSMGPDGDLHASTDAMTPATRFAIPQRLETDRLLLRMFRDEDWRGLHEHFSDAECTRFTFRRALTEAATWRAMASMAGHWLLRGYGPYAIEEKSTGTVLGTTGLWYPIEWPEPEIKWALARRHWGKGYASEAVRAVQRMARDSVPDMSPISLIDSRNAASIRLALAVGARLEREIEFAGGPFHIYRHPRKGEATT
ncbi:MAG: GNAT family N-acetyltransferase [Sulfuritalea sp.]|nr:GNAT family N-acetyltransferase [Sulfuritalea sp.]